MLKCDHKVCNICSLKQKHFMGEKMILTGQLSTFMCERFQKYILIYVMIMELHSSSTILCMYAHTNMDTKNYMYIRVSLWNQLQLILWQEAVMKCTLLYHHQSIIWSEYWILERLSRMQFITPKKSMFQLSYRNRFSSRKV